MKTEGETKHGIIANLLVRGGIVDAASLDRAVQIQTAKGGTLPRILSSLGLADEEKACATIADGLRLSYLEPDAVSGLGDATMSLLPADFSRERLVLALGIEGGALRLAMANPLDYRTLPDVEFRSGTRGGQRCAHRAAGEPPAGAPADRRAAGGRDAHPAGHAKRDHLPSQDHRQHGHRGAPQAAGRA